MGLAGFCKTEAVKIWIVLFKLNYKLRDELIFVDKIPVAAIASFADSFGNDLVVLFSHDAKFKL